MPALLQFIVSYFPIFLLGAIFGKLMDASGSAAAIAQSTIKLLGASNAIAAIVLACTLLTNGGVSLFVVACVALSLAAALNLRADLPKRLIPG